MDCKFVYFPTFRFWVILFTTPVVSQILIDDTGRFSANRVPNLCCVATISGHPSEIRPVVAEIDYNTRPSFFHERARTR